MTPDTTPLDRVRRYLDAREFYSDDMWIGSSQVGPRLNLDDLRAVVHMASEGVR